MSDVNERLLKASQGQVQLHPDQQKQYLGTFKERVVLTVSLADCRQEGNHSRIASAFDKICQHYPDPTLKINGKLGSSTQVTFLQLGQKAGMQATVVDDTTNQSPYGLLVHTNQAEDCSTTDIRERFPELWKPETNQATNRKPSLWEKLFGNKEG